MKRMKQARFIKVQCILIPLLAMLLSVTETTNALTLKRKNHKHSGTYIELSKKERCPVCGMFVSPYPKWITQIQHKDGSHHSFDGVKCMMRY